MGSNLMKVREADCATILTGLAARVHGSQAVRFYQAGARVGFGEQSDEPTRSSTQSQGVILLQDGAKSPIRRTECREFPWKN